MVATITAAVIACNGDPLSGPGQRPRLTPTASLTAGQNLGEGELGIPEVNDPNAYFGAVGGDPPYWGNGTGRLTFGTIPANVLAHIRVKGSISVTMNPEHNLYFDGTYPNVGTYGPAGIYSYGQLGVVVYLQQAGFSPYRQTLTSVSTDESEAWVQSPLEQTVTAGRNGIWSGSSCQTSYWPDTTRAPTGYVPGCTAKSGTHEWFVVKGMYRLSGSQAITIERAEADLVLSANRTTVAAGTSVTFTASISPSTQGGHPVPWQAVKWWWEPADSSLSCGTSASCSHQILGSGTMHVDANVNGVLKSTSRSIEVECSVGPNLSRQRTPSGGQDRPSLSEFACGAPDTSAYIILDCPASVARGGLITCSARSSDEQQHPLTVSKWTSETPLGTPINEEVVSSRSWSGQMATDTRVTVEGMIDSQSTSAHAEVTVTARGWGTPQVVLDMSSNGLERLDQVPDSANDLGGSFFNMPFISFVNYIQGGGPNGHMFWMEKEPFVDAKIDVNKAQLITPGQLKLRHGPTRVNGWCDTLYTRDTVTWVVEAHEGYNFAPGSHADVYRAQLPQWSLGPLAEAITAIGDANYAQMESEWNSKVKWKVDSTRVLAENIVHQNLWQPSCNINYFPAHP